ncbi:tripartite tricarboxylate transporter TctB family protein [Geodermatophilus sabuli]|uniref:Putative tricarboxylic transport membrane protein n=1 Tax=Geodermatophilus sabuli TaxID=1564158 RepID=A0A285ED34_9ACTN|nr:tripartite tricarboxylate transporter TctB family protein [Geodermatophilus sabuli]MBB3085609.1 putative tricarboxylic transport membrane protein [Geodermatophilus sabuli]SNX95971.1 putative tricarboxylic transport membrane protein [Geodermatophilus sabuli]
MTAPEPVPAPPGDVGSPATGPPETAAARAGRNNGELALTVLLGVLGVYLVVDAGSIAVPGSASNVGPRFFPYLVGGLIIVTAVALGVRVFLGDRGPADESEDVDLTAGTDWRAVGIIAAAFLAHALLINVIGWPLAVTLMFGTIAWALGARGIVRPLLAGGITSVVVWIVFVKALNVALPGGTFLELATSWF